MMYRHFLALARFDDVAFAYRVASQDSDDIMNAWRDMSKLSKQKHVPGYDYGVHVLSTAAMSFESIQEMDPYFSDVHEITDLNEFLDGVVDPSLVIAKLK